jgi:glutathionylspermidine synthase
MKRERSRPRAGWQDRVSSQGLTFHTPDGKPYWDESVCYRFSAAEVDLIEKATNDLQAMCLAAGQFIIDKERWADFHIPAAAVGMIRDAWNEEPPSIYGRFDLAYDGHSPPKLLEYNADTPTALLEAAVVQWNWLEDVHPNADQFNSIHEKLIAQWKEIRPFLKGTLYLTGTDAHEDVLTLAYMEDVARQAGIATQPVAIRDIGWNAGEREFRDRSEEPIRSVFALYPWEWLLGEREDAILAGRGSIQWIEPIWKMMWSNKALLAILWEMFPGHDNLLEAHLDGQHGMDAFVRKPLLSREGANIRLKTRSGVYETGGDYGEEGFVYQAAAPIPNIDGCYPVIGSWLITDQGACGMGVRESDTPITDNLSRFIPHYF